MDEFDFNFSGSNSSSQKKPTEEAFFDFGSDLLPPTSQ